MKGHHKLDFAFRALSYEGQFTEEFSREGQGQLYFIDDQQNKSLVYDGRWKENKPDVEGKLKIFGNSWYY